MLGVWDGTVLSQDLYHCPACWGYLKSLGTRDLTLDRELMYTVMSGSARTGLDPVEARRVTRVAS